ncbi:Hypothetical protein PHPALM_9292 [Phytophthora palmivora]|uniref:Uncharacterized protein n=1 Tax=Phytophthora palmivora TaxID=4796 RepID=A0A2P4Y7P0_9STRA|nr:Hypothetical protein PHPALM_9292 [Phytophthora palmivora]
MIERMANANVAKLIVTRTMKCFNPMFNIGICDSKAVSIFWDDETGKENYIIERMLKRRIRKELVVYHDREHSADMLQAHLHCRPAVLERKFCESMSA